mgnify:FL=1
MELLYPVYEKESFENAFSDTVSFCDSVGDSVEEGFEDVPCVSVGFEEVVSVGLDVFEVVSEPISWLDGSFLSLEGVFIDSEEGKESVSDWVVVETPDEEIGSDEFDGSFEQPTNVIRMSKQSTKISLRIVSPPFLTLL